MADRELNNALSSGELTNIQLGGTGTGERVLTNDEVDTKLSPYLKKDGSNTVEKVVFDDVTGNEPSYATGQMYYADKVWNLQDGYPDVTLQVGREQQIEVVNNTGATILNGKAVRHNGVSSGVPQVVLALADTFVNATVLGVATHDIPTGQTGIITTFGSVGGLDTTSFSVGTPMYLSDTVAGDYQSTPPSVVTQVGGVLTQDATIGQVFVSIDNNVNLPTAVGNLKGQASPPYRTTPTPIEIDVYSSNISLYTNSDTINGEIELEYKGLYELLLTIGGDISDEEVDITIELYDVTNPSVVETVTFNSGRGSNPVLVPFSHTFTTVFISPTANTKYVVRMSTATNQTVNISNISYTLKSIKLDLS